MNNVSNYEHRSLISKFRISAHLLPIELGKMQQISRSQRTHKVCTGSQLDNKVHLILGCTVPRLVKLDLRILVAWEIAVVVNNVGGTREYVSKYVAMQILLQIMQM